MNKIFINPGSGQVEGTEQNASENMKHLIADLKIKDVKYIRVPEEDGYEGRFAFLIWKERKCSLIHMAGLALEKVRYVSDEQDIWQFPRLYIDGSSFLWKFVIELLDEELEENENGD